MDDFRFLSGAYSHISPARRTCAAGQKACSVAEVVLYLYLRVQTSLLSCLTLLRNGKIFGFDFESQPAERAHVNIGDPHRGKLRE
jgi:hypothetical protein